MGDRAKNWRKVIWNKVPYIKLTDRALYVNLIYDDGKLIYHFLCIFIREYIPGTSRYLFYGDAYGSIILPIPRIYKRHETVSFSFPPPHFITRINRIFHRVSLQFRDAPPHVEKYFSLASLRRCKYRAV